MYLERTHAYGDSAPKLECGVFDTSGRGETVSKASWSEAVVLAVLGVLTSAVHAQGLTDYKLGQGGGPVTGSASEGKADNAAPTLERCSVPLGTMAVVEPQDLSARALLQVSLPSPTGLIRLIVQQSNCFSIVERGVAMQSILQERQIQQAADQAQGAQSRHTQLVTADFVLTPDVVFSESDAGGLSAALTTLGSFFGVGGLVVGMAAAGLKFKQAQTSMIVSDTRTGLQVAAAQGSVEKADWNIGTSLGGGIDAGTRFGAYGNTAQGKVVAASFLDNWNNIVRTVRANLQPERYSAAVAGTSAVTGQPIGAEKQTEEPSSTAPTEERKRGRLPEFDKGDILVGKIGNIKMFSDPLAAKTRTVVATLGRNDVVVFLGREVNGHLHVQSERGSGWVEKFLVKKGQ